MQCTWQCDSLAPRDRIMITPHFNDTSGSTDASQLCQDLAEGLALIHPFAGEIRVTSYDAQGTKPVYPNGEHVINPGLMAVTAGARELAICLSYFSDRNVARRRGRLYIPAWFLQVATTSQRPPQGIAAMAALVDLFTGLGGVDVDWSVFSRVEKGAHAVSDWWYDDEWDVMRSRGLRGTTRTSGQTSESLAADAAIASPMRS